MFQAQFNTFNKNQKDQKVREYVVSDNGPD